MSKNALKRARMMAANARMARPVASPIVTRSGRSSALKGATIDVVRPDRVDHFEVALNLPAPDRASFDAFIELIAAKRGVEVADVLA